MRVKVRNKLKTLATTTTTQDSQYAPVYPSMTMISLAFGKFCPLTLNGALSGFLNTISTVALPSNCGKSEYCEGTVALYPAGTIFSSTNPICLAMISCDSYALSNAARSCSLPLNDSTESLSARSSGSSSVEIFANKSVHTAASRHEGHHFAIRLSSWPWFVPFWLHRVPHFCVWNQCQSWHRTLYSATVLPETIK